MAGRVKPWVSAVCNLTADKRIEERKGGGRREGRKSLDFCVSTLRSVVWLHCNESGS